MKQKTRNPEKSWNRKPETRRIYKTRTRGNPKPVTWRNPRPGNQELGKILNQETRNPENFLTRNPEKSVPENESKNIFCRTDRREDFPIVYRRCLVLTTYRQYGEVYTFTLTCSTPSILFLFLHFLVFHTERTNKNV